MKTTTQCSKCGGREIYVVPGHGRVGNLIRAGRIDEVIVDRFVCVSCGYSEEWITPADLALIQKNFKSVKSDFLPPVTP